MCGKLWLENNDIHAAGISCLAASVCAKKIILSSWLFLTNNPLGLEGVVPVARILSSDHFMGTFVNLSAGYSWRECHKHRLY